MTKSCLSHILTYWPYLHFIEDIIKQSKEEIIIISAKFFSVKNIIISVLKKQQNTFRETLILTGGRKSVQQEPVLDIFLVAAQ